MNPYRLQELARTPRSAIESLGEKPYFFMPKTRRSWIDAMTNGVLALQCVVQANHVLYEAGNEDSAPAVVAYTTDPARCLDGGFLQSVGERLHAVKEDPYPREAELKEVQQLLLNEHSWFNVTLPLGLTWGVPTTMRVVTFLPEQMPGRCIPPDRLIPCVIGANGDLWHLKPTAYL